METSSVSILLSYHMGMHMSSQTHLERSLIVRVRFVLHSYLTLTGVIFSDELSATLNTRRDFRYIKGVSHASDHFKRREGGYVLYFIMRKELLLHSFMNDSIVLLLAGTLSTIL